MEATEVETNIDKIPYLRQSQPFLYISRVKKKYIYVKHLKTDLKNGEKITQYLLLVERILQYKTSKRYRQYSLNRV